MVADLAIGKPDLHCPHVARLRRGRPIHEVPEDVGSVLREGERTRRLEHQVRLAEGPAFGETGRSRPLARISFRRSAFDPPTDEVDLRVGEPAFALEASLARLGEPWGHVSHLGHFADLRRARLHVGVAQQAEGPGLARTMADRAVRENDRGDVSIEGGGITAGCDRSAPDHSPRLCPSPSRQAFPPPPPR